MYVITKILKWYFLIFNLYMQFWTIQIGNILSMRMGAVCFSLFGFQAKTTSQHSKTSCFPIIDLTLWHTLGKKYENPDDREFLCFLAVYFSFNVKTYCY